MVLTNGDAKKTDKYVGAGCGEMKYVAPPAKPNCFCIIPLSTLLCLLPLLLYWLMGTNTAQTTSLPYDCNAGLANAHWQEELSETNTKKADKTAEMDKLSAKIDQLTTRSAQLNGEIASLQNAVPMKLV